MTKPTQGGFELIVYQIAQLEKAITVLSSQFSSFQEKIEARVQALEEARKEDKYKTRFVLGFAATIGGVVGFLANIASNYMNFKK